MPASNTPQSGQPAAPDGEPSRETTVRRLKAAFLVLALVVLPAAGIRLFTKYMYEYRIPAGTAAVDQSVIELCSPLAEYIRKSGMIGRFPWIEPYLGYRYYIIPDGATEICPGAFCLDSLTRATIRGVRIPDTVKKIGEDAFLRCTGLRDIVIPDSVEEIGYRAFQECISLEEARIPGPVVMHNMFKDCTALKKVVSSVPLDTIGSNAFSGCVNLSGIDIPSGKVLIDMQAFLGCVKLPPVTLGRETLDVGDGAFTGTGCRLTVPDGHPSLRFENGLLYRKLRSEDTYSLISCVSAPDGPCIVTPGTERISARAFFKCVGLTDIRLPDGLQRIYPDAFRGCTGLKRVKLPSNGLKLIGNNAFADCTSLTEITIPEGVDTISFETFRSCAGLKRVNLPDSLTTIEEDAFSGCSALEEITIPDGVTVIGERAFHNCANLKRVSLPSSLKTLGRTAFEGCTALETPVLPPGAAVRSEDNWF